MLLLKQENLGRVYTSKPVAKLMVELLVNELDSGVILDPCIGENIFFTTLQEEMSNNPSKNFTMVGLEVDSALIPEIKVKQKDKYSYCCQNFFDYEPSKKHDGIIMNPPYIRQEILVESNINPKNKIIKKLEKEYSKYLSRTHNLYIYFFMKAHQVLRNKGKIVAICYDSWLFTKFGELFQTFLEDHFEVKTVIHFEEKAFTNAEVGATVLELVKRKTSRQSIKYIKFMRVKDYEIERSIIETVVSSLSDLPVRGKNIINFSSQLFLPLSQLCAGKIRRGISPKAKKYFLFDDPKFNETIPIIKDVKKIDGYKVSKECLSYILYIEENNISGEMANYLNNIKFKILNQDGYKTLKREINSGKKWYSIRLVKSGNFIFNYYLRKNIKFIYNPQNYCAAHNFYILEVAIQPFIALAILNSILTKIAVLSKSRSQGSGLKKIQLYKFNDIPIINPNVLKTKECTQLEKLGKELEEKKKGEVASIIKEIDQILLRVYNELVDPDLSLELVYKLYKQKLGGL